MYYKAFKDRSYCFQPEMFMTAEISAENNSFGGTLQRGNRTIIALENLERDAILP